MHAKTILIYRMVWDTFESRGKRRKIDAQKLE